MSRLAVLLTTLSLVLSRYGAQAASVQHCHFETDDEAPIPFCVAVSRWENRSTHATDLLVTFGYQREGDKGWGAIGLGESMFPSLIFATYGMQSANEELFVSVRDGRQYREPRPSPDLPKAEKLRVSYNSSRWLETSFVCYGCEDWAATRRSSFVQPWIWAFNLMDEIDNATADSSVFFHAYTGLFALDMSESTDKGVSGRPGIPSIDQKLPNQMLANKANIYSHLVPVHGTFLGVAMMILYPCGIIVFRGMPSKARVYLSFQILGSVSCAVGAAAIIYAIAITGWVDLFKTPHALVGITVLLLIPPQIYLGYAHHKSSTEARQSATLHKAHTWLGGILLFGGLCNTIFGLELAGFSTGVLFLASGAALFVVAMILYLPRILHRKEEASRQLDSDDEDAIPLLENGADIK